MGIKLKAAGMNDFVIIEAADGVGGTWRLNRYPGCACDVQAQLYSYSFAPSAEWTRPYPRQPEILAYFEACAADYGLLPHCRFATRVAQAVWSGESSTWTVSLSTGETMRADVLISGIGMFNEPTWPDIDGLDAFGGTVIHSARWDPEHDLTGEWVAVIGSAASAVQLMPEVAKIAANVDLYQRTPNWVLPKADTPFTDEEIERFRADPSLVAALRAEQEANFEVGTTFSRPEVLAERERVGLAAIEEVRDPALRARLTPDHPFGCKRPLFSNDYYAAFNRPNVSAGDRCHCVDRRWQRGHRHRRAPPRPTPSSWPQGSRPRSSSLPLT